MTGRRSPFERTANRFMLQERDIELFIALYQYGFLTNDHIKELCGFGCLARVNIRLRKLYDNNYLSRTFLNNNCGQARIVHFLGPEAVPIIAERLKIDPLTVKKRRKGILKAKESAVVYCLAINNVRLAFALASKKNPEVKMGVWRIGKQAVLKSETSFYPNAYFNYHYQSKRYNLFLEVDRFGKSHNWFKKRMRDYLKYGHEGYFSRQFGFNYFKVLIVCANPERLKTLMKITSHLTDGMFWLTTAEQVNGQTAFDRIWFRPRQQESHSLLEIKR